MLLVVVVAAAGGLKVGKKQRRKWLGPIQMKSCGSRFPVCFVFVRGMTF